MILLSDENDRDPVVFDTNILIEHIKWNNNGEIICTCGKNKSNDNNYIIQFYKNNGDFLKQIPISSKISGLSFDGNGYRLGFSSDQSIFFCNIKYE